MTTAPIDSKRVRHSKAQLTDPTKNGVLNTGEEAPLLPHSEDAERAVFGCLLLAPEEAGGRLAQLRRSYFYVEAHRLIFDALQRISANGQPLEVFTLRQMLEQSGNLAGVEAITPTADLPDAASNPGNFGTYLKRLVEMHQRRAAIQVAARVEQLARDLTAEPSALLEHVDASLRSSFGGSNALPAIADAANLIADKPKAPPELVCGLLHQGSKLVLGGSSKANKTWTLLDLAISVATGEPWLSIHTVKGRVLYLNPELHAWAISQRIETVCRAKTIELPTGRLDVWNLRGHNTSFDDLLPRIRARVAQAGYALIVLDPIYKLLGGLDENKAGDIGRLLNEIESLASGTGAAVAFSAHFAKGNAAGKESIDRISGSGVFARDPDAILVMTKHEEEGAFVVESTLRNFKPVEPFVVRWLYPLMRRDDSLDPSRLKQPKSGRPKRYTAEQIVEVLGRRKLTTTEWCKRAYDKAGVSHGTFYDLLKEAVQSGIVEKNGDKYERSPKTQTTKPKE